MPVPRVTMQYILSQCLLSSGLGGGHIAGWREDFLKEVVFEFSCSGWVCFCRYGLTEHGPTGKGRKVSKGVDTRHGEVNSVSEGTVNK